MKKIAVLFSGINAEYLSKIQYVADGYEVADYSKGYTLADLVDCDIIFGNLPANLLSQLPNLKWLHTHMQFSKSKALNCRNRFDRSLCA